MGYLTFSDEGLLSPSSKTRKWSVYAESTKLGIIKWYAPWRRYAFFPEPGTLFEEDCLNEIAIVLESKTKTHKAMQRA